MAMDLPMQIAHAVHVLNHDVQSCNRVAANQWLVQFQRSHAAWEVAASLLVSNVPQAANYEVELFAAQVLKRKIQTEVETLSSEACTALQNALLLSAKKFSSGPAQLLTQICLALSALLLRALDWRTPVEQLFASLNDLQDQGHESGAIVELLTVLPEEVIEDQAANSSVATGRRSQFSQELLAHTVTVLEFLLRHANDNALEGSQKQKKVLRCFLSWVKVGCFLEIPQSSLPTHPLLDFVYSSLQVPATFELAVEVLTELVVRHEALPEALLPRIILVKESLLLPALASGNENIVLGLTNLMSELGQAAPAFMAQASPDALSLTDALLRCTSFPSSDWQVAESTLQFWCTLAEYLLKIKGTQSAHQQQITISSYIPVFEELLNALVVRSQVHLANHFEDDMDRGSGLPDGLTHFRKTLDEPFADICQLLTPARCICQVLDGVEGWFTPATGISWQAIESRLFALQSVAEIVVQEGDIMDQDPIMHLLFILSSGSFQKTDGMWHLVHKSAAQVVGCYSIWICNYPSILLPIVSFLASGLTIPVAAGACASALKKVCEDVSSIARDQTTYEGLLQIGENLHSMKLSLQEEEDVICAVSQVLTTLSSSRDLSKALERLLSPSYDSIGALLKTDCEGSVKLHSAMYSACLGACVRGLYRLEITFRQFCGSIPGIGEEAIIRVWAHFWPLLQRLFGSRHLEDNDLASAACKTLSQAMRTLGPHFSPLLLDVMPALYTNFVSFQSHVCLIKTAGVAVEEFGSRKAYGPLFIKAFSVFTVSEAMSGMSTSYACDQDPDLAEAYMNFSATFVRCCPQDIVAVAEALLETSVNRAAICSTAMHRGAALAALSYIASFLDVGVSSLNDSCRSDNSLSAAVSRICLHCGENIISGILYALLGVSAKPRVHKATTILQLLSAFCFVNGGSECKSTLQWSSLQDWLVAAIQGLPPEYLRRGEEESIISSWVVALKAAALDYVQWWNYKGEWTGYEQGDGARSLKRVIRDFADTHRYVTSGTGLL